MYIAKEDLDNATDYVENAYINADDVRAVVVSVQKDENVLWFTVRNSNQDNKPTAFQTHIKDIFNYDYFLSTKKNKFRIGRGAIGDANKPKLSIPYTILHEKGHIINGMEAPLTITYNDQVSKISLDTSKFITNKLEAIIKTQPRLIDQKPYTEVKIALPTSHLSYDAVNGLKEYCLNYSIFSTHIRFFFDFDGEKVTTPDDTIVSNTWTNEITAWAYTNDEFLVFIESLVDQSIPVSTALASFRELKWLPKGWKQKRLDELSTEDKTRLLKDLKYISRPMEKLSVPFGGNKKGDELRKEALIKRIAAVYDVDESLAEYKVVRARYESPDGEVSFPYVFEAVTIPFKDIWNSNKIFIGAVNNSVSIINRGMSLYDGYYTFYDKHKERTAWNMSGILDHWYGLEKKESKKSWPCIIACNLLTPKVHWREQGKSTLVIEPFADTIVETITKVMKKIPTFHGMGIGQNSESKNIPKEKKRTAIDYLRDFLRDRRKKVETDPSLRTSDRLTQRGVFYRNRRIMIEDGFKPPKDWGTTGQTMASSIMKTCQELWPNENITREYLGIVASARAVMIYQGQSFPVDIDSIKQLATKGIAVLVIEKEGIADILAPFARDYHIALVHTQGKLTEYGKDLIEEIKNIDSIVWVLTDYDAVGMDISKKARTHTLRIGVTRETVQWLQDNGYDIEKEDVQEEYTPPKGIVIDPEDEYLKTHRIELDSIVEKVGGEGLWNYIIAQAKLPEFSPNDFNLGKIIDLPEDDKFYPEIADTFKTKIDLWKNKHLQAVDDYLQKLLETRKQEIEDELENHELVKIQDKRNEIDKDLQEIVDNDKDNEERQKIEQNLQKIMDSIDKLDELIGIDPLTTDTNDRENREP